MERLDGERRSEYGAARLWHPVVNIIEPGRATRISEPRTMPSAQMNQNWYPAPGGAGGRQ